MNYYEVNGEFFLQFVKMKGFIRHTEHYNITMFLDPNAEIDEPQGYIQWTPRISFYLRKDLLNDLSGNNRNSSKRENA